VTPNGERRLAFAVGALESKVLLSEKMSAVPPPFTKLRRADCSEEDRGVIALEFVVATPSMTTLTPVRKVEVNVLANWNVVRETLS
jgi:hypothetical protein